MNIKKLVASLLLLCTVTMLSAQNMDRRIIMTVKEGAKITLDISADNENTVAKVRFASVDSAITLGRNSKRFVFTVNKDRYVYIYGNVRTLSCYGSIQEITTKDNPGLESLNCSGTDVGVLTLGSNSVMKKLQCFQCNLYKLDVSGLTALEDLECGENSISSLTVGSSALVTLHCENNQLTLLDLSRCPALKDLDCSHNSLGVLDVGGNPSLESLACGDNPLTGLDVSKNTALKELICYKCLLNGLDLTRNTALTLLDCESNNNVQVLNTSNNRALKSLTCSNCNLAALDLGRNSALEYLNCSNNKFSSLDVSNNTALKYIECYSNALTTEAWDALMCSLPERKVSDSCIFVPWVLSSSIGAAQFLKSNSGNAKAKHWLVMDYFGKEAPATSGTARCDLNMKRSITMHVENGARISFDCSAYREGTSILVASGAHDTVITRGKNMAGSVKFTAGADTITIYGDVKGLDCRSNGGNLTGLDISHNPSLQLLACPYNSLTRLDVEGIDSLKYLYCLGNPFTTQAFDDIMCALPERSGTDGAILRPLQDGNDTNYAKFMAANSANAKAKNWSVYYWVGENDVPATSGKFDCAVLPVREAVAESSLRVWPNPARTQLHIANATGVVTVCDLTGRVVCRVETSGSEELRINIAGWAKGMYFVRVGRMTVKVVKE